MTLPVGNVKLVQHGQPQQACCLPGYYLFANAFSGVFLHSAFDVWCNDFSNFIFSKIFIFSLCFSSFLQSATLSKFQSHKQYFLFFKNFFNQFFIIFKFSFNFGFYNLAGTNLYLWYAIFHCDHYYHFAFRGWTLVENAFH